MFQLFKLQLFLLLLPYFSNGNFVCIQNEYFDENDDEPYLRNGKSYTNILSHGARIYDYNTVINQSIIQDVFTNSFLFDAGRSMSSSSAITTVYKFQNWLVPRFRYNYNVIILDFEIPKDSREVIFVFIAREIKTNNVGGDCKPRSLELVLKPHGYPISNITMPEDYVNDDKNLHHIDFESDSVIQNYRIENPFIGSWFARVYRSWTNPNDDSLGHGIEANCDTYITGEVSVHVQAMVNHINCDEEVEINLQVTDTAVTDYYSCFISTESARRTLKLSINLNAGTGFVILRLQGKKLTSKTSEYQCALKLGEELNQKLSLTFTPYIKTWHYLDVTYGKNAAMPRSNIELCENIKPIIESKISITELIRFPKPGLFLFEYESTNPLVSIKPDELETLKFDIYPTKDMGGVLTVEANINSNETSIDVVVCFGRDIIFSPNADKKCQSNFVINEPDLILSNDEQTNTSDVVHIPYPEVGTWYITLGAFGTEMTTEVNVKISSSPCSKTDCGKHGRCEIVTTGNQVISACRCTSGLTGWLCSDDFHVASKGESLTIVLLLTLSNLFFIPSVVFGIRRKYYTEALVYAFTMFFSTFYHACDSTNAYYGLCITKFGVLQYADFFCAILSFWVTLVAMASLSKTLVSLLHIFGAVLIAFGTELNRFSFLLFLIPILSGLIIIVVSWVYHCKKSKQLFPGKKYLMFFFPAGVVLALVGLVCFAFLQTIANYHIVHSIWHITVALSVLILLPIRSFFFTDEFAPTQSLFNSVLQNTNYR